jgi:hypothetical protein
MDLCGLWPHCENMYKLVKNTLVDPIVERGCLTTVGFMWFMAVVEVAFFAALGVMLFI